MRNKLGNFAVTFSAFLVTGVLAISSITGFTQFLTVKNKIDASLIEAEKAGLVYISDNLSDSSLLQNPDQAQIILNDARTIAIARAVASLGEPTRLMLIDRNGPELTRLYQNENTLFEISPGGDKINIQLSISANVLGAVPFRYNKRSPLREVKPSDIDNIITTPSIECNATNNCGECGICDQSIGECIPNLLVPSKEPVDNPDAQGIFACKDFDDTVPGEFCTDDAGGVIFTASNREEGCNEIGCMGPSCPAPGNGPPGTSPGDPDPNGLDCRFVDNFFAWNIIGDKSTGNIKVYWDGTVIDSTSINASDTSFTDPNGDIYTRSTLFPFGINQDDSGNDTYSLCKGNLSTPEDEKKTRIFVSSVPTGQDVKQTLNLSGVYYQSSIFFNMPGIPFNNQRNAADGLCSFLADRAGLIGTWKALAGYGRSADPLLHPQNWLPSDFNVYRIDGVKVNLEEDDPRIPSSGGTIRSSFWSVLHAAPINIDENGQEVNSDPYAQTHLDYNGFSASNRGLGGCCSNWLADASSPGRSGHASWVFTFVTNNPRGGRLYCIDVDPLPYPARYL